MYANAFMELLPTLLAIVAILLAVMRIRDKRQQEKLAETNIAVNKQAEALERIATAVEKYLSLPK